MERSQESVLFCPMSENAMIVSFTICQFRAQRVGNEGRFLLTASLFHHLPLVELPSGSGPATLTAPQPVVAADVTERTHQRGVIQPTCFKLALRPTKISLNFAFIFLAVYQTGIWF